MSLVFLTRLPKITSGTQIYRSWCDFKNVRFARGVSKKRLKIKCGTAVRARRFKIHFCDTPRAKASFFVCILRFEHNKNALCVRIKKTSFCDMPQAKPSLLTFSWPLEKAPAAMRHDLDIGPLARRSTKIQHLFCDTPRAKQSFLGFSNLHVCTGSD